jgi:hypothetical protein
VVDDATRGLIVRDVDPAEVEATARSHLAAARHNFTAMFEPNRG